MRTYDVQVDISDTIQDIEYSIEGIFYDLIELEFDTTDPTVMSSKAKDAFKMRIKILCRLMILISKSTNENLWVQLDSALLALAKVLEEGGLYGAWGIVESEIKRVFEQSRGTDTSDKKSV